MVGTQDVPVTNSAAFGIRNDIDADNGVAFGEDNLILPGANNACLLYTSPSPRDRTRSRMPSSA